MTTEIAQLQQEAKRLKGEAQSVAQAAKYLKMAAEELKPVVAPAASRALVGSVQSAGALGSRLFAKAPAVSAAFGKLATADEKLVKRGMVVGAVIGALSAVGVAVGTVARIRSKRRRRKAARQQEAEAAE